MARINTVAKAQKDQGNCRACGKPIKIGDPYKWAKPRYRGKVVACVGCQIPISALSSSKMVAVWDAQEAVGKANTVEDIAQALHYLAQTAEEVGGEYREAAENQQEYFPDSEVAAENEQKADELEQWASEVEEAANEVDNIEETPEELEKEEEETEEEFEARLATAQEEAEETALEEAQEHTGVADECPA